VRTALDGDFRAKFQEKGYVLLAWGDVGPVQLFTNVPVKTIDDLKQVKLWAWVDDPLVRTLFQQLGLNGVPLGVPDVLPALQTGLINACYGSPLATLALQWHSKVKYATSMVLSQSVGAVVMWKPAFDGLSPDAQKAVMEESVILQGNLHDMVDKDNRAALDKMKQQGLQVMDTPAAVQQQFATTGDVVAQKLEGQVYSHDFRVKVQKLVAQMRAGK
jgi:TRAP-type C4-dicarboxylate transport system substrate-binding protein